MESRTLKGHLDSITSSGILEGWAVDPETPLDPVAVVVETEDGACVARGHAQLYRADLSGAALGTGWCAFRLRSFLSVPRLSRSTLILLEAETKFEIHRIARPAISDRIERPLRAVPEILVADPTKLASLDQLDGCGPLFAAFIAAHGVEAFVRTSYVYVLGRPADEEGVAIYSAMVRSGELTPYALLYSLARSDGRDTDIRQLAPPPSSGFPFRA